MKLDLIANEIVPAIWLFLSPFVMGMVFGAVMLFYIMLKLFSVQERRYLYIVRIVLIVTGCLSAFYIFDFWYFRRHGCHAISPINEDWFLTCCPPDDLHKPYRCVPLIVDQTEYQIHFNHRYFGKHSIALNVVNKTPKPFEYNNPDPMELTLAANICLASKSREKLLAGEKSFGRYFLNKGTNVLEVITYDFIPPKELEQDYVVSVRVEGDLQSFLQTYPGSYLSIRNSTHK